MQNVCRPKVRLGFQTPLKHLCLSAFYKFRPHFQLLYSNKNDEFIIFACENLNTTLNKNTSCSISYIFYKVFLNVIQNDETLYEKSIELLKSKEKTESYKCFVKKLLQDEKIKVCSF